MFYALGKVIPEMHTCTLNDSLPKSVYTLGIFRSLVAPLTGWLGWRLRNTLYKSDGDRTLKRDSYLSAGQARFLSPCADASIQCKIYTEYVVLLQKQ